MSAFGKIVGEAQYVHKSSLGHLEQDDLIRVRKAVFFVPDGFNWNVVKIDLKNTARFSFLEYTDFEVDALRENLSALLADLHKLKPASAKGQYLKKIAVSTTMGPGLVLDQAGLKL